MNNNRNKKIILQKLVDKILLTSTLNDKFVQRNTKKKN